MSEPRSVPIQRLPSGVEKLVGLVDAELPADVLGAESLGGIEKVPRGLSQPAEHLLLDRCAIHENGDGLAFTT